MDSTEAAQDNLNKEAGFEAWYGSLKWEDPYPDFRTLALLAWKAGLDHKTKSN